MGGALKGGQLHHDLTKKITIICLIRINCNIIETFQISIRKCGYGV